MHCLVFTDTDLYSLTKGKSYLAKQKWRRSTCLRDQCYDVGCHPSVPVALKKKQTVSVEKRVPSCPIQTLNTTSTCRNCYINNRAVMTHSVISDKLRKNINNKLQYDTKLKIMGRNLIKTIMKISFWDNCVNNF